MKKIIVRPRNECWIEDVIEELRDVLKEVNWGKLPDEIENNQIVVTLEVEN